MTPTIEPAAETDALEVRRLLVQTVAEIDRGLQILDAELKQAQFHQARRTVRQLGSLVQLQDQLVRKLPRSPKRSERTNA